MDENNDDDGVEKKKTRKIAQKMNRHKKRKIHEKKQEKTRIKDKKKIHYYVYSVVTWRTKTKNNSGWPVCLYTTTHTSCPIDTAIIICAPNRTEPNRTACTAMLS